MDVRRKLNQLYNTRDFENIEFRLGKPLGGRVRDIITEADIMDMELDIIHRCLTKLYNHPDNEVGNVVKEFLDEIELLRGKK